MAEVYVSNLNDSAREKSITLLKDRLAEALDLTLAVKQAHWTIKGPSFIGLHELLDEVATRMRDHADEIAERCVILGGQPHGTIGEAAQKTSLDAYPADAVKQTDHVEALTSRLKEFGARLRKSIDEAGDAGDEDTADLFTGVSRVIDKDAWFIGSHIA